MVNFFVLLGLGSLTAVFCADREVSLLRVSKAKEDPETEFFNWALRLNKAYVGDEVEYNKRFQIWKDNVEFVH